MMEMSIEQDTYHREIVILLLLNPLIIIDIFLIIINTQISLKMINLILKLY